MDGKLIRSNQSGKTGRSRNYKNDIFDAALTDIKWNIYRLIGRYGYHFHGGTFGCVGNHRKPISLGDGILNPGKPGCLPTIIIFLEIS